MFRFLRPRWLDLVLLAGIASLVAYVKGYGTLDPDSAWATLWPNLTTDLLFVWLAARVIDGLGEARQRRLSAIGGLRGALNFLMRLGTDLLPELYPWRIRDVKDELRWFQMRLERSKALRSDEVARAEDIANQIPTLIHLAEELRSTRSEGSRLADLLDDAWRAEQKRTHNEEDPNFPTRYQASWLDTLEREHRAYIGDTNVEQGALRVALAEARRRADGLNATVELRDLLNRYISAVEVQVEATELLKAEVAALVLSVRDNEMILMERWRD